MEKVAAAQTSCSCSCSCYNNFLVPKLKGGGFLFLQAEQRSKKWRSQPLIVKSQMISNATTYTSRISTDIPLYEIPGDEWRIHMLPIEFLFMTAWPVIDMRLRCKSKGIEYPPGVPNNVSKVLELDIIRWELQGLDDVLKPSQFSLAVKGSLYPYRVGPRSRLKGQLQMSISFVLSPMLALVPDDVRRDVAESVLRGLLQNMKSKVNGSLLSDYAEFKRETQKNLV
ncbi:uncharacterized protein LOC132037468 isoform X2 [Lycium ferocissimum]|uniref:uncharacterized protein LOC132037468 isoform X2 n=1 Tax=Lycium ferocissimum TaxID=112874 RepID=UPI0028161B9E|nr:uncharacterized protein LOC132037468 isoform X2 [Lycium ferocissimum]